MVLKERMLSDTPRGVASRRLNEQTPPQARFLESEDILNHAPLRYDPKNPQGKILLGAIGDDLVGIAEDRHILTVAGSRAGKSVGVINNLYFYNGSVMVVDPKGELASKTAIRRARLGQKPYILDPFGIVKGEAAQYRAQFNPMARLTLDNEFIIEDALNITDALIVSSGQEKDPHWNEAAEELVMGIIIYVAISPDIPAKDKHLITVRKFLNNALAQFTDEDEVKKFRLEEDINDCAQKMASGGFGEITDAMIGAIRGFYDKSYEERSSVISTARRQTRVLGLPSMKKVLTGHDFDLEDLKRDPNGISVYLVLPATRMNSCNRWLRIFVNQLLEAMERETRKPEAPVLVCLDEFPVLGFMKQLQDAAGQIASFHVKLWVIMQDWGQGVALYGKRFESFAGNAGVWQFFGNVDNTTTEYISRKLGKTLVEDIRFGEVTKEQKQKGLSGRQVSRQLYPLLTPDEFSRTFARNDSLKRQLILWAGVHPMILQRVEYFDKKFNEFFSFTR